MCASSKLSQLRGSPQKPVLLRAGASVMPSKKGASSTILILVCFLFMAIPAQATTYYVAAAGSDSNNGTESGHPWQTIAQVNGATFSAGRFDAVQ